MDQAFLERHVNLVAEAAIGGQRRRVVRPDVEHHLVAEPQQLRRHGGRYRGSVPAAAEIGVSHHVADDRELRRGTDDVSARRRDQSAADPDAEVEAVGDGAGR
jgi:hypothetical protein